jgi:hypothetical protein
LYFKTTRNLKFKKKRYVNQFFIDLKIDFLNF